MKKKISVLMTVLLLAFAVFPGMAYAKGSGNILFADPAYTVSDEDLQSINATLEEISESQKCEVVIYTTTSYYGAAEQDYADDYYDHYGYGYGDDKSGILLVVNPDERSYAISTCGYGITAFTDAGLEYIVDQIKPYMSDGDYASAFNEFAVLCDEFLTQAYTGEPYDAGNLPGTEKAIDKLIVDIPVGVGIGLLIAFIMAGKDKAALRTIRRREEASEYLRQGSLQLTGSYEEFLYNNIETVRKESNSGGSSTHTSSSGQTHGGTSGRF